MGFLDAASSLAFGARSTTSRTSSRHGDHSKKQHHHKSSKTAPTTGSSFGDWAAGISGGAKPSNRSTTSFFSVNSSRSSTSSYKRSPRRGFVARMYAQLRRLLRRLGRLLTTHPLKTFMLVVVPLVTGGALTALLARFGVRLRMPRALRGMVAGMGGGGEGKGLGGVSSMVGGVGGLMGGVGGLTSVVKLFI